MYDRITWRTWVWGALAFVWLVVVFGLAGMNGVDSGRLSLWVTEHLMCWLTRFGVPRASLHHVVRKLAHAGVFAVEGFLVFGALRTFKRAMPSVLIAAPLCALFAVANEYAQTFAEGRACNYVDMLIDFGGSVAGIAVCALLLALFAHSRKQNRTKE